MSPLEAGSDKLAPQGFQLRIGDMFLGSDHFVTAQAHHCWQVATAYDHILTNILFLTEAKDAAVMPLWFQV